MGPARVQGCNREHARRTLGAVPTPRYVLALLLPLAGLGCASTIDRDAATAGRSPAHAPQRASLNAREASSRVEGAAFLALRVGEPLLAKPVKKGVEQPKVVQVSGLDEQLEEQLMSAMARCPAEMALVGDRVCVDRWEGSLVERLPGGGERPWSPYLAVDGSEGRVRAVSKAGVIPQGYISGKQAASACRASGKRLCTAGEWESACRGGASTQFPYGAARRSGVCNDDIRNVHPVAEVGHLFGITKEALWRVGMNQSIINQLEGTLAPTGARSACTNDYGVFDMVGNLHEWIDDPDGTFRGGYYMDTSKNGEGCAYATTAHDFTYHDYSTGFRCCMDPDRVE